MMYDWNWSILWDFRWALLQGAGWTLLLSAVSIIIGSLGGLLWGLVLAAKAPGWIEFRLLALFISDSVRALPLLILLLLVNYYGPYLVGIHSVFWISCSALSLNLAAFIADVTRGAIEGVPLPLQDAGLAIGMTGGQVMRRIVMPEAIRSTIPTIALLYIDILKMSSLASVIAFPELTHVGSRISSLTYRPLEVFGAIALVYLLIVLPFAYLQRWIERSPWLVRRS